MLAFSCSPFVFLHSQTPNMRPGKLRQLLLIVALLVVFGILLLAKLSALQAYVLSGCFAVLAGFVIVLNLRD